MKTPLKTIINSKGLPEHEKAPKPVKKKQIGTDEERAMYRQWKLATTKRNHPTLTDAQIGTVKMPAWKLYSNMLEDCIKIWAEAHGHMVAKIDVKGTYRNGKWNKGKATKGVEDMQLVVNGQFIAIEVKAGKDRMSEAQLKRQAQYNAQKVPYFVVRTLAEFLLTMKQFEK